MRFLEDFPIDAMFGHCVANGQVSSGRCVDLKCDSDRIPKGRTKRLILSETSIRGMAGHFGMVDEYLHAKLKDRVEVLEQQLAEAEAKIVSLLGTLQAFGLPEPKPALPELAPAKKKPAKKVAE